MSLDLTTIAVFVGGGLMYAALLPRQWRGWLLLIASVLAVYWLQPRIFARYLDFALPTLTLLVTVFSWWVTRPDDPEQRERTRREDRATALLLILTLIALVLLRNLPPAWQITASRPPPLLSVALPVGIGLVAAWLIGRAVGRKTALAAMLLALIGLFVVIKTEPLAVMVSQLWRGGTGQSLAQASLLDLNWLGFSYIAFRLIHTVRDRQSGVLPDLSLREYVTYVVFFPSLVAGPIDRAERFVADFRALPERLGLDPARLNEAGTRISIGLFKKFVIADTLAQGMALNPINAAQTDSTLGMWALLYGYALRLFFDFSGYTDIAIGIGLLFGIKLPENFNRPYLRTNIAAFWQSWHITLSDWVRFYVFSPLTRHLLRLRPKPPQAVITFAAHMTTMAIIGLWHGVTGPFFIWGLWHGLGLFAHNRWSQRTRKWYLRLKKQPERLRAWSLFAWFLTFHFVVLGWVWFALPDVGLALRVFRVLFGLGG